MFMAEVAGADAIGTSLTTGVTAGSIFGAIQPFMGFVVIMIIVAFGLTVLRKVIKKAQKGKAGV